MPEFQAVTECIVRSKVLGPTWVIVIPEVLIERRSPLNNQVDEIGRSPLDTVQNSWTTSPEYITDSTAIGDITGRTDNTCVSDGLLNYSTMLNFCAFSNQYLKLTVH